MSNRGHVGPTSQTFKIHNHFPGASATSLSPRGLQGHLSILNNPTYLTMGQCSAVSSQKTSGQGSATGSQSRNLTRNACPRLLSRTIHPSLHPDQTLCLSGSQYIWTLLYCVPGTVLSPLHAFAHWSLQQPWDVGTHAITPRLFFFFSLQDRVLLWCLGWSTVV